MASGTGLKGGQGRCNPFWLAYAECMYTAEDAKDCRIYKEDYLECGRQEKQFVRKVQITKEWRRKCTAGELPCSYQELQDFVLQKERLAALNGKPSPYADLKTATA